MADLRQLRLHERILVRYFRWTWQVLRGAWLVEGEPSPLAALLQWRSREWWSGVRASGRLRSQTRGAFQARFRHARRGVTRPFEDPLIEIFGKGWRRFLDRETD